MNAPRPRRQLPLMSGDPGSSSISSSSVASASTLSVGFVIPFGEAHEGYFPDALLEVLCARARAAGHRASLVRVYYDGHSPERDAAVRAELDAWLEANAIDVVVAERMFDPVPVQQHLLRDRRRHAVLVSWGDGDAIEGFDLVLGRTSGPTRSAKTRRSPSAGMLVHGFAELLEALATGADPLTVPGVARVVDGELVSGPEPSPRALPRPFEAALDHEIIAAGDAPAQTRKYLFGNAGCPFADDPGENPHYEGVDLGASPTLARLGCAFCHFGGDYEKRPNEDVVAEVVEQAAYYLERAPDVHDLVLGDQHALRYLAPLIRAARERDLRPARWLFAARADAFVREEARVSDAIEAAAGSGHRLELYLTGFEAFCDRELARYNKGADVATLLEGVRAMRRLAEEHPDVFGYAYAKGHSLVLWNPWTTPDDLLETTGNVRRHGLRDLFEELGKNRLRLYPDLPITLAAERDGAVADAWDTDDEGAARNKGYSVERPWRFLDTRTRVAFSLARALRDRLGHETELAQLEAVARFAGRTPVTPEEIPALLHRVETNADALLATLDALAAGQTSAPRLSSVRAAGLVLTGDCNNGCVACGNRDRYLDRRDAAVWVRLETARASGAPIALAGREPSLHPAIGELVRRAHGSDRRLVGVVTNGRRFAYPAFTRALVGVGLGAASVKIFAASAAPADAVARDSGAFAQALAGVSELRRAGVSALELRLSLHPSGLASLPDAAELASRLGVSGIRVEVALDALGLDSMAPAVLGLELLTERCAALGMPLGASRLEAGAASFDSLPGGAALTPREPPR